MKKTHIFAVINLISCLLYTSLLKQGTADKLTRYYIGNKDELDKTANSTKEKLYVGAPALSRNKAEEYLRKINKQIKSRICNSTDGKLCRYSTKQSELPDR